MPAIDGTAERRANSGNQEEVKGISRTNGGAPKPALIVVMGVSGTGKSTLGSALAKELGVPFIEGDDLHPKSNIDKMSAGIPLNDKDREPWLELIRTTAEQVLVGQESKSDLDQNGRSDNNDKGNEERIRGVVVGCSALKKYYRDILRGRLKPSSTSKSKDHPPSLPSHLEPAHPEIIPTYFVFIDGPRETLYERMEKRPGHFMKASMLDSQLNTLEDPRDEEGVIVVSIQSSTEKQVLDAKEYLRKKDLGII